MPNSFDFDSAALWNARLERAETHIAPGYWFDSQSIFSRLRVPLFTDPIDARRSGHRVAMGRQQRGLAMVLSGVPRRAKHPTERHRFRSRRPRKFVEAAALRPADRRCCFGSFRSHKPDRGPLPGIPSSAGWWENSRFASSRGDSSSANRQVFPFLSVAATTPSLEPLNDVEATRGHIRRSLSALSRYGCIAE
jgi:hypothetical protein